MGKHGAVLKFKLDTGSQVNTIPLNEYCCLMDDCKLQPTKFIWPLFGQICPKAPMRQLLKQSDEFLWDKQHDAAFQKKKDIITKQAGPVLAYYDPTKEHSLQSNASKYGLGAILLEDGRPISYASKSLTESEVNYAPIDKEMYAILFGFNHSH